MNFWDVFGEMLVILFAIAAGYAANRLGYLGGEADQKVSKLLLNITMPAMIVAAVITGEELPELGTILSILEVGVVFYLLEAVFALVVPRFLPGTQGQKGVWRYALAFPNVGFIGYPVAVALFGDGALFYAAILALPFNLLSYSLGPPGCGRRPWWARCWTLWETSPCRCPCWWWAPCWRACQPDRCCALPSCGC